MSLRCVIFILHCSIPARIVGERTCCPCCLYKPSSALVALCERKCCWIMFLSRLKARTIASRTLSLLRYPFLSTVNFYVHCPEWYSGTPKDDLAPRHWFSAAGSPKTLVAFWGAFRRWSAESPQSVAPRYTC